MIKGFACPATEVGYFAVGLHRQSRNLGRLRPPFSLRRGGRGRARTCNPSLRLSYDPLFVNGGARGYVLCTQSMQSMPPTIHDQWVRPALTVILCLAAIVLLWYGAGALFDHDPSATGSVVEH